MRLDHARLRGISERRKTCDPWCALLGGAVLAPPEAVRNMAYTHDKATMPAIHNVMQQARSCSSACIGDGFVDLAWLGLLTVDSSLYS